MSVRSVLNDPLITVGSHIEVETEVTIDSDERPTINELRTEWFLADNPIGQDLVYKLWDDGAPSQSPRIIQSGPGAWRITLKNIMRLRNDLVVADHGSKYYFQWVITVGGKDHEFTETFIVHPSDYLRPGFEDAVTKVGYPITIKGIVEHSDTDGNSRMPDAVCKFRTTDNLDIQDITISPDRDQSGHGLIVYESSMKFGMEDSYMITTKNGESMIVHDVEFAPPTGQTLGGRFRYFTEPPNVFDHEYAAKEKVMLKPSLDPIFVEWQQTSGERQGQLIGYSKLWFWGVEHFMAADRIKKNLEAAFVRDGSLELVFSDGDYADFLLQGRDYFNSVGESTTFTLEKPEGKILDALVMCAQLRAAESRSLEESLKVVDFSGQGSSLNIEFAQAYETFASNMLSQIENHVVTMKRQMALKGLTKGDGSNESQKHARSPKAFGYTSSTVGNASTNFYFYNQGYRY